MMNLSIVLTVPAILVSQTTIDNCGSIIACPLKPQSVLTSIDRWCMYVCIQQRNQLVCNYIALMNVLLCTFGTDGGVSKYVVTSSTLYPPTGPT